jgi:IS30 family transposase
MRKLGLQGLRRGKRWKTTVPDELSPRPLDLVDHQFWQQIATGITSEKAAIAIGVSQAVGTRWFRHRGGMPLFMSNRISGRYLSFAEREEIGLLQVQGVSMREIARRLGRSPSTISRELTHNAATRGGKLEYRASVAQWKAEFFAKRPRPAKLTTNPRLRDYVQERLAGKVKDTIGNEIDGPSQPSFNGRNKPHRGDRKWVNGWSPEQISNRLKLDFPDDKSMRISHECIHQALYIQGRGALKRELVTSLCTGRGLCVPRARCQGKAWAHVHEDIMISERPAEVEDRALPGHWEGDLIIGLNRSAIGTLVERKSRYTLLVHLPREAGYGEAPRVKNGPALAGYAATTMTDALKRVVASLPDHLWCSLTWDRGKELSDHARFTIDSGVKVFFADPHSPWQRGTNENTNGLLRQYFPKGTDLIRWRANELQAVANTLNARPRKTLGWKTPAEVLDEHLKTAQTFSVATTG